MKIAILIACLMVLLGGCSAVGYVKSELTGQAKPEGGIAEVVPATKTFSVSAPVLRRAVRAVLEDQAFIVEELANGSFRTEPKVLGDPSRFALVGATYSARVNVRVEGQAVTYRARFDKKSNVVMAEQNAEYPEKENELRREFFDALAKQVGRP